MFIETEGNRMGDDPSHDSVAAVRRRPEGSTEGQLNFDSFYVQNRDQIARALSLSLRNADLGAEAADEAFVRACQRWAEVSTYTNPQGWIYRVAMNWARSWLRRARRERDKRPLLMNPELVEDDLVDVDLERALGGLSPSHRTVVVARFFMEWSVDETAEALGIRPGTVKSRLSRALSQLSSELSDTSVLQSGVNQEDVQHEP
jgi:RNA polymerase sigma-70 factor (ECF subfamily)